MSEADQEHITQEEPVVIDSTKSEENQEPQKISILRCYDNIRPIIESLKTEALATQLGGIYQDIMTIEAEIAKSAKAMNTDAMFKAVSMLNAIKTGEWLYKMEKLINLEKKNNHQILTVKSKFDRLDCSHRVSQVIPGDNYIMFALTAMPITMNFNETRGHNPEKNKDYMLRTIGSIELDKTHDYKLTMSIPTDSSVTIYFIRK